MRPSNFRPEAEDLAIEMEEEASAPPPSAI
jgi:hypothetical protein